MKLITFFLLLALYPPVRAVELLDQDDVIRIVEQAASYARRASPKSRIAIVDRQGYVLGVWDMTSSDENPVLNGGDLGKRRNGKVVTAITRATTAAFLSSAENAFTSRTAGFIIQQHFPPGVMNTPPGPLVGVGFSNFFVGGGNNSDVNFAKQIPFDGFNPGIPNVLFPKASFVPANPFRSPGTFGLGVPLGTLSDSPGGVPLYKGGECVGGIGVCGDGSPTDLSVALAFLRGFSLPKSTPSFKTGDDSDEGVARAGQRGYGPNPGITADKVFLGGIRIPYVKTEFDDVDAESIDDLPGRWVPGNIKNPNFPAGDDPGFPPRKSPPVFPYEVRKFGGYEGEVRFPLRDDPTPGRINGVKRLEKEEVEKIIELAAERAKSTRAGIRLPIGVPAKVFISVVGNPGVHGKKPPILGIFRTGEATVFSWDVAVQKARTALFFSSNDLAFSTRTVGFLAQRNYPPGLDGRRPGPYFGLQESITVVGNGNVPNGITIFPGGFPLYRNGQLVGAIGVSGDGVDQDDIISISGVKEFKAPVGIRADQFTYDGARLPYVKFPRDPNN